MSSANNASAALVEEDLSVRKLSIAAALKNKDTLLAGSSPVLQTRRKRKTSDGREEEN